MNKEIKFLMKFDTSEFDKAIEKMQRQLKEVYRPADMAGAQRKTADRLEGIGVGGGGKPGVEQYFKSIQNSRREMDTLLQKYSKDQQNLIKDMSAHEASQKRLAAAQAKVIQGSQEELRIQKELKNTEEQLYRMRESWMARNQAMNQAIDARQSLGPKDKMERLMTAFGGGGMKGGGKEAGLMAGEWWKGLGMTGQAGMIISGLLAASKGVSMVGDAATAFKGIPLQVAAAQGSATQNTFGKEVNSIYGGNQVSEMAFRGEKGQAAGMADEHIKSQKFWDKISTGQFTIEMAAKAARYSPMAGAVLGGLGAFQQGVAATGMMGERRQNLVGGEFSKSMNDKYQMQTSAQYAEEYAKATEDLKNQNPLKTAAVSSFAQRREGDLAFQRATGLNNATFHGPGGFRESSLNAGFTDQQGMSAAQGILSSGGSTRGATGNSVLSMQAQRGMDMTNANSVIGKLSGQMGDSESSRQAFIRMLAEGSRIGLDSSQFREENRRFMDAASSIVEKSGTTSQSDIESLTRMFGGFTGAATPKGMEAAQTAFQTYNAGTSATSGAQGAMRASAFLSDPMISGMDGPDMAALAGIDMEHLATDHPVIKSLARRYNKNPQEIVDAAKKAGKSSFNRMGKGDDLQSKLTKLRENLSKAPSATLGDSRRKEEMQQQIGETEDDYTAILAVQYPALANDPQALKRLAQGASQPGGGALSKDEMDKQAANLANKDTGRVEDKANQADAEGAKLMLTTFQQMKDLMAPSATAVAEFNGQLLKLLATLNSPTASKGEKAAALQDMNKLMPKEQTQVGK